MKKSTGFLIILSFFLVLFLLIGIFVGLIFYMMQGTTPNLLRQSRVALVRVEGVIFDAKNWLDQIKQYQEDDTIRAIILQIDSPGGAVGPSQELYDAVIKAREEHNKIVVAYFASVAASGGYYAGVGADYIVSSPGCMTGSIGVYARFLQAQELMEKIGVEYETVKAGDYKTAGSMDREMTPEEREMFQSVIDDTYAQFVEAVVDGRKQQLSRLIMNWKPEQQKSGYPFTDKVVDIITRYQSERQAYLAQNGEPVSPATAALLINTPTQVSAATVASTTLQETTVLVAEPSNASTAEMNTSDSQVRQTPKPPQKDDVFPPSEEILYALGDALAEGKIYTGRQAESLALVDKIGTLDDAIEIAARMVGIQGEPTVVERQRRELTIFDLLTQKLQLLTEQKSHSPLMYQFPY
ncbi:MAG: signal peptide peptidase SppA [bacterium]|jgi:signal peptide peptidase SppA